MGLPQNKNKSKKGVLPAEMLEAGRYHAAVTTEDVWICYPWEAKYVLVRILTLNDEVLTGHKGILTSTMPSRRRARSSKSGL